MEEYFSARRESVSAGGGEWVEARWRTGRQAGFDAAPFASGGGGEDGAVGRVKNSQGKKYRILDCENWGRGDSRSRSPLAVAARELREEKCRSKVKAVPKIR